MYKCMNGYECVCARGCLRMCVKVSLCEYVRVYMCVRGCVIV